MVVVDQEETIPANQNYLKKRLKAQVDYLQLHQGVCPCMLEL